MFSWSDGVQQQSEVFLEVHFTVFITPLSLLFTKQSMVFIRMDVDV